MMLLTTVRLQIELIKYPRLIIIPFRYSCQTLTCFLILEMAKNSIISTYQIAEILARMNPNALHFLDCRLILIYVNSFIILNQKMLPTLFILVPVTFMLKME
eukprot:NODE_13_length_54415_cov_0.522424.p55 type:complete len:102 gc:universal NODE_13_length_54415_cov_0.522424:6997-7302(+)